MEKLTRHSLYLAFFLGTVLTVAGLCLYPELSILAVVATVLIIMAGIFLLAWLFFRVTTASRSSAPPQPHTMHEELEIN